MSKTFSTSVLIAGIGLCFGTAASAKGLSGDDVHTYYYALRASGFSLVGYDPNPGSRHIIQRIGGIWTENLTIESWGDTPDANVGFDRCGALRTIHITMGDSVPVYGFRPENEYSDEFISRGSGVIDRLADAVFGQTSKAAYSKLPPEQREGIDEIVKATDRGLAQVIKADGTPDRCHVWSLHCTDAEGQFTKAFDKAVAELNKIHGICAKMQAAADKRAEARKSSVAGDAEGVKAPGSVAERSAVQAVGGRSDSMTQLQ